MLKQTRGDTIPYARALQPSAPAPSAHLRLSEASTRRPRNPRRFARVRLPVPEMEYVCVIEREIHRLKRHLPRHRAVRTIAIPFIPVLLPVVRFFIRSHRRFARNETAKTISEIPQKLSERARHREEIAFFWGVLYILYILYSTRSKARRKGTRALKEGNRTRSSLP